MTLLWTKIFVHSDPDATLKTTRWPHWRSLRPMALYRTGDLHLLENKQFLIRWEIGEILELKNGCLLAFV
jgi:hypothetical protein